jgi:enoyl-CoA hydratase
MSATEALATHLVTEVVGPLELMTAARRTVERIAAAPREVLMRTKAKALRRAGYAQGTSTLDL